MLRVSKNIALIALTLVSFGLQTTFAAIIEDGSSKKANSNNKYNLKSLSHGNKYSPFSLNSLKKDKDYNYNYNFADRSIDGLNVDILNNSPAGIVEITTPVRIQKGNNVYIYDYKYRIPASHNPLPFMKAPSNPNH
ncbi:hypothetical protein [Rhizosphaericola mali]|uniref:Uncharacterized protein n=1 Tax=Rhizosphaericola mali TaxID=2545455 RepID=A0A5P2G4P8_9BACT|nr:hypothetical protein [Rhizosphaericola mali]QES90796.1 hypothetical protein E0W69_019820 [Rhizosphaericola mali]